MKVKLINKIAVVTVVNRILVKILALYFVRECAKVVVAIRSEVGDMGAERLVEIFYTEDIRQAANPEEFKAQKITEYRNRIT